VPADTKLVDEYYQYVLPILQKRLAKAGFRVSTLDDILGIRV
jgi:hypothetical protein